MRAHSGPLLASHFGPAASTARTAGARLRVRAAKLLRRSSPVALTLALAVAASGCTTGPPPPVSPQELAGGELFPFFRVYWVGRYFLDQPLTAVDNRETYIPSIGESVDYGTCAPEGGLLGGGPCQLPLAVTTVVYVPHVNKSLSPQQNAVIRGVPAVSYDQGREIALYSGHLEIDLSAATAADALAATRLLRPLNAPGSSSEALPSPTYCPGLSGPLTPAVNAAMARLRARLPKLACPRISPDHPSATLGSGARTSGLPRSLRRARNAPVPMIDGTHSEIAR
jgi:hypothetical protein